MSEKCFYDSMELYLDTTHPALLQGLIVSLSQLVRLRICLTKLVSDHAYDLSCMAYLVVIEFLKKCAPIDHAFYKAVFKTQMFINFVEQRSYSYSMDTTVAFFDECTEKVKMVMCYSLK